MSVFRSDMERTAWAKVEGMAEFHWSDLAAKDLHAETAQVFIRRWEKAGRIRQVRKEGHRKIYVNVNRAIPVVPPVRDDPTPEGNMWRVMRRPGNFTPVDLVAMSNANGVEVSLDMARAYCRKLLEAGYLRVRETAIPGRRQPRYQLIRNTGPRAPMARRITVLEDANEGTFHPLGDRK